MKKEEFKKWWKEHKKVIGMVTVLSAMAVGGAVALVIIEKDSWKKGQKIIDSVVSDTKKADVGDVFWKLTKAGNVNTDLNGFWATVEWDCND